MELIDANILIRFLVCDHKQKAEKCRQLLTSAVESRQRLYVSDLTLAEVVWVLEKVYKCRRPDIHLKIEAILNTPNLVFQNKELMAEAAILYDAHNVDFIDAYHAALLTKLGIKEIYSYDKDFDRLAGVIRKEP
ncbi:type II toxin-antitoxin system VapC family toxin [Candidatus Saganbacteria bacterium]|nr:type II toxin-antitoxin system VapC family toxin [Candidatus Saganbacteria bacterium]